MCESAERFGASILVYGYPGYPEKLARIPFAPPVLFRLGDLPPEDVPVLAMIGSRRCTPEGNLLARQWARELAGYGLSVASGMARAGAVLTNHESAAFEWARDKNHPRFRDMSGLLKEGQPGREE